jgi:chemotaxis protein MotB
MKQLPYLKLTEVESQTAIWASLMFMLLAVLTIVFIRQRLSNELNTTQTLTGRNASQQQNVFSSLQQTFAAEIRHGEVSLKSLPAQIRLTINTQQLFQPHRMDLSPTGKNAVNRLAQTLKAASGAGYSQIQIEGHTERDGYTAATYPRDNWELSSGQAVSVLKYLASAAKLEPKLFSAHGYADTRPLASGQTGMRKITATRLEVNIFFGATELR